MPVTIVGTMRMAAQADIFLTWLFWRTVTIVRFTLRMLASESWKPSTCSITRSTWSYTSRRYLRTSGSMLSRSSPPSRRSSALPSGLVARRNPLTSPESLGFYLLDVLAEAFYPRTVVVYDLVHDGVQDGPRAPTQQPGLLLQAVAHRREGRDLPVTHRHHEVLPHEDVRLAELYRVRFVEVAGGLEHDEKRSGVALELGPLVGLHGVLDGQLVQPELFGYRGELLFGRPVESDPGQRRLARSASLVGLAQRMGVIGPLAVHVEGVIHYHARIVPRTAVSVRGRRPCLPVASRLQRASARSYP